MSSSYISNNSNSQQFDIDFFPAESENSDLDDMLHPKNNNMNPTMSFPYLKFGSSSEFGDFPSSMLKEQQFDSMAQYGFGINEPEVPCSTNADETAEFLNSLSTDPMDTNVFDLSSPLIKDEQFSPPQTTDSLVNAAMSYNSTPSSTPAMTTSISSSSIATALSPSKSIAPVSNMKLSPPSATMSTPVQNSTIAEISLSKAPSPPHRLRVRPVRSLKEPEDFEDSEDLESLSSISSAVQTSITTATPSKRKMRKSNKPATVRAIAAAAAAAAAKIQGTQSKKRKFSSLVTEEERETLDPEECARLEKNRQSARNCRLRKKQYILGLESKVEELEKALEEAHAREARLQSEVERLRARR